MLSFQGWGQTPFDLSPGNILAADGISYCGSVTFIVTNTYGFDIEFDIVKDGTTFPGLTLLTPGQSSTVKYSTSGDYHTNFRYVGGSQFFSATHITVAINALPQINAIPSSLTFNNFTGKYDMVYGTVATIASTLSSPFSSNAWTFSSSSNISGASITNSINITAINVGGPTNLVFKDNIGCSNSIGIKVIPATLTVTASDQSKSYGATSSLTGTLNTNYTVTGLLNTDAASGIALSYSGSPSGNLATASVGTYSITTSGLTLSTGSLSNYTIGYVSGTLTINAATLTVTASNQSKLYGATSPLTGTLTTNYTVTGLLNTDAASGVALSYSGSPSGNLATASVGTYSITTSGLTLSTGSLLNYTIGYVSGTLTINAATLTVTDRRRDGRTEASFCQGWGWG